MSSEAPQPGTGRQGWIKWRQGGLVIAALLLLAFILYMARGALFPFIISIVLAELLYPVVVFMEERMPGHDRIPGVTRIVSILTIYVGFAVVVAGILYLTIPPLFAESQEFIETFPEFYESARSTVEGWSHDFTERVPLELRMEIEEAVAAGGNVLADAGRGVLLRTVTGVSNAVTLVIGLAIVPFFLFYILKDREDVVGGVYPMMSERGRNHTRNVIFMVNQVIGVLRQGAATECDCCRRPGVHRPLDSRHQVRRHTGTGGRTVRTDPDNRPGARSRARTARHAGELAQPGNMGCAGLRHRSASREQCHIAAHTWARRPSQSRDHYGDIGRCERGRGTLGRHSRSADRCRREGRIRLLLQGVGLRHDRRHSDS